MFHSYIKRRVDFTHSVNLCPSFTAAACSCRREFLQWNQPVFRGPDIFHGFHQLDETELLIHAPVRGACFEFGRLMLALNFTSGIIWPPEKFARTQQHGVFVTYFGSVTFRRLFMLSAHGPIARNFTQDGGMSQSGGYPNRSLTGRMLTNRLILGIPILEYTI